jgi:hypothetical protein
VLCEEVQAFSRTMNSHSLLDSHDIAMTESRWRNGKQGVVANRSQAHATDSTAIANRQFSLYNLIDKLCQNSEIFDRLPIALTSFLIHSISKHL